MAKALAHPEWVSLAAGFVDHQTLPVEPTRQALEHIWSDPAMARKALQYGTTIGYPPLRRAILERLLLADGQAPDHGRPSIDQVVITAGSNQLLHLLSDVLFDPGDIVLCGCPSYYVFLGTLDSVGAMAVGVETDEHGIVPAAVDAELARREAAGELGRVKLIYVTTYYDNPTGVTLEADRRAQLVEIAHRWSRRQPIYILEDAAYRELRYYGDDQASIHSYDATGDTVIHAGTFSKSFSPGIRVGWGVLPPALVKPILTLKGNIDFGSPSFNQVLMSTVVAMGLFDTHVATLREEYRRKIDAILAAADDFLTPLGGVEWVRPTGGLYLWVGLPEGVEAGVSSPLFAHAMKEGVLYVPGEACYPDRKLAPRNTLRLSFGVPSCEVIRRGIEALGRALRRVIA
jgi:2-aminoadipate transaminase